MDSALLKPVVEFLQTSSSLAPRNSKDVDATIAMAREVLDRAAILLIKNIPMLKAAGAEVIEFLFIPRTIARQLVLAVAVHTGIVTINQVMAVVGAVASNFSSRSRLIRQLEEQQRSAETQDEWMDLAERIDAIQGNDLWRIDPNCALYESDRVSARVDEFVHLIRRHDIFELMFTLRGGIARNKFGLLHDGLFSKALAGSKVLVETYHNVVCAALDFVCDAPVLGTDEPIPTDARLAFFNETRHSYGRTALLLSGGAALGFYHVGVVKALMDNGLLPRVLGGASAGSIVCAMIGTRTDEECQQDLFHVKGTDAPGHSGVLSLNFFRPIESPRAERQRRSRQQRQQLQQGHPMALGEVISNSAGAFQDYKRAWQGFAPIGIRRLTSFMYDVVTGQRRAKDVLKSDSDHLRECIRNNVGDFTFQEAFDRTGRILNIIVSPQNRSDPPRLLNYLTAPHVLVWSAAVASSSLPGVFESQKLLVKDADGTERYESAAAMTFQDGSMEADLPMQQLSEMFNVNHFIISQANPHAVMFASFDVDGGSSNNIWTNAILGTAYGLLRFFKNQIKAWIRNGVDLIGGRRVAPLWDTRREFFSQFFTQEYMGRPEVDISLVPWSGHMSLWNAFLHIIYNPSEEEFFQWAKAAERETWKYIPQIKSHVAEEMTLDRCVQRLRQRVVQESWEKHVSMASAGEKMGERVPSFFTSPSLVNMSGHAVTDPHTLQQQQQQQQENGVPLTANSNPYNNGNFELRAGWGGMGLRGNHSQGSLARSNSASSGLFLDDGDEGGAAAATLQAPYHPVSYMIPTMQQQQQRNSGEQVAGEQTATQTPWSQHFGGVADKSHFFTTGSGEGTNPSTAGAPAGSERYMKTSSMANFYYRKTQSHNNLTEQGSSTSSFPPKVTEEPQSSDGSDDGSAAAMEQRRSKSTIDLGQRG